MLVLVRSNHSNCPPEPCMLPQCLTDSSGQWIPLHCQFCMRHVHSRCRWNRLVHWHRNSSRECGALSLLCSSLAGSSRRPPQSSSSCRRSSCPACSQQQWACHVWQLLCCCRAAGGQVLVERLQHAQLHQPHEQLVLGVRQVFNTAGVQAHQGSDSAHSTQGSGAQWRRQWFGGGGVQQGPNNGCHTAREQHAMRVLLHNK